MKKYVVIILLFLISGSLLGLAYFLEFNFYQKNDQKIDREKFQQILFAKEAELTKKLNYVAGKTKKHSFSNFTEGSKPLLNIDELKSKGFSVFIYYKDSLIFWSDNTVKVGQKYSTSELEQKIENLNNGWYDVCTIEKDDYILVGLILIKKQYSYENEFLRNEFHPDFKLPPTVNVSYVSLAWSDDIYDQEKNFLFALVPKNKLLTNIPYARFLEFLYFAGFIFLLFFFQRIVIDRKWPFLVLFVIFIALRYFMTVYRSPVWLYKLPVFSPMLYAQSDWLPSLGDLFINSILIYFFAYNFFVPVNADKIEKLKNWKRILLGVVYSFFSLALIIVAFYYLQNMLRSIIFDSSLSFEVYKVLSIDFYSFIGYSIIALLLGAFAFITDKFVNFSTKILEAAIFIPVFIVVTAISVGLAYYFKYDVNIYSIIFPFLLIISNAIIRFRKRFFRYYTFVFIISIISIYTVTFITDYTEQKQRGVSKVLVSKLVTERDPIAEHLLRDIELEVAKDEKLKSYINAHYIGTNQQAKDIVRLLQKRYFHGYWDKYNLGAWLCGNSSDFDQTNQLDNCIGYFRQNVVRNGQKIPLTNFHYFENQNRNVSYQGYIKFESDIDSTEVALFIELAAKVLVEEVGYPELLLDKKVNKSSQIREYSYAKYRDDTLVIKSGNLSYDLIADDFSSQNTEYAFVNKDDYEHVVYKVDGRNKLVLSRPALKPIDLLVSFSYLFVFFNILVVFGLFIYHLPTLVKGLHLDFKTKLQISMFIVLFLSILLVGGGTIYYNIQQYKNKHKRNITEKVQSVAIHLEQIFAETTQLTPEWRTIDYVHLDELLSRISLTFFADVNLYDLNGELLRSSRPEVFDRGLVSKKINPIAYSQLKYHNKAKFVQEESIGDMTYTSAYVPFKNQDNKILAYLNLPYFTKPGLLKKEISTLLVAVVNLYVILFLIAIVIAVFISNKVTQPLRLIENKFREIELGKKYEQIDYKGNDEIGSLVKEYNRMVVELAESVELLAKSERESAWREMAKQIAHEIKNPLTPMKLSVQFLTRSWKDRDSNFEKRFDRVTNTLIEQIDNLSAIAQEFSNFAKMPKANNKDFNIINTIKDTAFLFENTDDATVNYNLGKEEEIIVFADEKQVSRVFINLIKNGIQAVPNKAKAEINLKIENNNESVIVSIKDNGTGITEDKKDAIFTPNFTTKSSGMGMGLAIVKNIIENANGKIWFETDLGMGTTFFVELPLDKNKAG